jgi:hypothetical protein
MASVCGASDFSGTTVVCEFVRTGIGCVQSEFDFEADSLCFLRAADSGTVMKTHSRPKAVQFWQGWVLEHRLLRVRHSTHELIGRGLRLLTTLLCTGCSGMSSTHFGAILSKVGVRKSVGGVW